MAPRSWIEASRLTITLRPAMRIAPRESVTVVIIGKQFGRQTNRQRHREQQRIQNGPAEHDAGRQHHDHEGKGQPRDHEAEFAQVALERRGALGLRQG